MISAAPRAFAMYLELGQGTGQDEGSLSTTLLDFGDKLDVRDFAAQVNLQILQYGMQFRSEDQRGGDVSNQHGQEKIRTWSGATGQTLQFVTDSTAVLRRHLRSWPVAPSSDFVSTRLQDQVN